jgi:hypothetical protein
MIADDLLLALDPVAFAAAAGYDALDDWQARLLRSPARQLILNCSRQSGKSSMTAVMGLHTALYTPRSLVLLLAPALRQSQELFRKVKEACHALGTLPTGIEEESALRLEFRNRSRIVCLPGKEATIRGFSGVSLLIVDEAARVDELLYVSTRPMLAVSGGRIILLSTPFGRRGFYFREWTEGVSWERIKVTAYDCPRISREFLEQERRSLGELYFRSEYMCEFVETVDSVFRYQDVEDALDDTIEPLIPTWRPSYARQHLSD